MRSKTNRKVKTVEVVEEVKVVEVEEAEEELTIGKSCILVTLADIRTTFDLETQSS
jgi:hypothetical protein